MQGKMPAEQPFVPAREARGADAMKEEFRKKREEAIADIPEREGELRDRHFADVRPEHIDALDEEDAAVLARIRGVKTVDDFLNVEKVFNEYFAHERREGKENVILAILAQELYRRAPKEALKRFRKNAA